MCHPLPFPTDLQIFPITESSAQHLRVKLVSLKAATPDCSFRKDVRALGRAMLAVAGCSKNYADDLRELRSYNPSLFFLIEWMISEDADLTMAEVLRHPYFMSPSEWQTFAITMGDGGGMIKSFLRQPGAPAPGGGAFGLGAIVQAIRPTLNEFLSHELARLFEMQQRKSKQGGEGGGKKGGMKPRPPQQQQLSRAGEWPSQPATTPPPSEKDGGMQHSAPRAAVDKQAEMIFCSAAEEFLKMQPNMSCPLPMLGSNVRNPYRNAASGKTTKSIALILQQDPQRRFVVSVIPGSQHRVSLAAAGAAAVIHIDSSASMNLSSEESNQQQEGGDQQPQPQPQPQQQQQRQQAQQQQQLSRAGEGPSQPATTPPPSEKDGGMQHSAPRAAVDKQAELIFRSAAEEF
jgi:hypothetical protein